MKNQYISDNVADETVEHIYHNIWKEKVHQSLSVVAPTHALKVSFQSYNTLTKLWSGNNLSKSIKMKVDQPIKQKKDNFLSGNIPIHFKEREKNILMKKESNKTNVRFNPQKNGNPVLNDRYKQKSLRKNKTFDQLQPLRNDQNKRQKRQTDQFAQMQNNLLRIKIQNMEKNKIEEKEKQRLQKLQKMEQRKNLLKKFQQMRRVAFDYSGAFFRGTLKVQDNQNILRLKQEINQAQVKKRQKNMVQTVEQTISRSQNSQKRGRFKAEIQNRTNEENNIPKFVELSQSRKKLQENIDRCSQQSEFRHFRTATLSNFKNVIKDRKFIAFRPQKIVKNRHINHAWKSQQKLKRNNNQSEDSQESNREQTLRLKLKTFTKKEVSFDDSQRTFLTNKFRTQKKKTGRISIENKSIFSEMITQQS